MIVREKFGCTFIGEQYDYCKKRDISVIYAWFIGEFGSTLYEYFFLEARWNEDEVAQRKADLFFREVGLSLIGFSSS